MREEVTSSVVTVDTLHARRLLAAEGYIDLGMFGEAQAELRELDPSCFALEETLVLQLSVYAGLHQWENAHELATELAASAACRVQSVEAAKGILLRALVTHPDNANIHYNLSCYETRLSHFYKARRHLARAIQLDPRFKLVAMDDTDLEPLWTKAIQMAEVED
jgi:tetratricopeptide (TPR) repeat protein